MHKMLYFLENTEKSLKC